MFAAIIPTLWALHRGYLSMAGYAMLIVFFLLHNIGAHYTYSLVPYDQWFRSGFGFDLKSTFGFERNHYDRLVHFLFGLLIYKLCTDLLGSLSRLRGRWIVITALLIVTAASTFYEMIEWGAAVAFGKGADLEYVGTQGDPWDAHKDQLLAIVGAFLAAGVAAIWPSSGSKLSSRRGG